MANQWYIRRGSKITGPFNSDQIKSQVATGAVQREDEISQSSNGPWTVAWRVKGLFPKEPSAIIKYEPLIEETNSHKPCPFCAEKIQAAATKCKHCGEFLNSPQTKPAYNNAPTKSPVQRYKCPVCLGPIALNATSCPSCGYKNIPIKSNLGAGCLGFLLGPVGLWYKGNWAAGFAWLVFAIIFGVATGGIAAPFFWVGMAIHAYVATPKN